MESTGSGTSFQEGNVKPTTTADDDENSVTNSVTGRCSFVGARLLIGPHVELWGGSGRDCHVLLLLLLLLLLLSHGPPCPPYPTRFVWFFFFWLGDGNRGRPIAAHHRPVAGKRRHRWNATWTMIHLVPGGYRVDFFLFT